MDIQLAKNHRFFTCYIIKYMNKPGKCELSDTIVNNKNKNKSLASYLWNIALRFTNNRECRALEAVDTLLSVPSYKTVPNTTVRWLDTIQKSKKL